MSKTSKKIVEEEYEEEEEEEEEDEEFEPIVRRPVQVEKAKVPFEFTTRDRINGKMDLLIDEFKKACFLETKDAATLIALKYNWSVGKARDHVLTDEFNEGVVISDNKTDAAKIKEICDKCRIPLKYAEPSHPLPCGHCICNDCMTLSVCAPIQNNDKEVVRTLSCPFVGCKKYRLPPTLIKEVLNAHDKEINSAPINSSQYMHMLMNDYLMNQKNMRFCPSPTCSNIAIKKMNTDEVHCECGNVFCFSCDNGGHSPATCEDVAQWLVLVSKPETRFGWKSENIKPCPNCHQPTNRYNSNQITCKHCNFSFCYICRGDWAKTHSDQFTCNAPKEEVEAADKNIADMNLNYVQFYYTRWISHTELCEAAKKTLPTIGDMKQKYCDQFGVDRGDAMFLEDGFKLLVDCRRTIANTYIYGYAMTKAINVPIPPHTSAEEVRSIMALRKQKESLRKFFHFQQGDLEQSADRLASLLDAEIPSIDRRRILDFMANCRQFFEKLNNSFENDDWASGGSSRG